jgi:CHASE3 domain sensor protein
MSSAKNNYPKRFKVSIAERIKRLEKLAVNNPIFEERIKQIKKAVEVIFIDKVRKK